MVQLGFPGSANETYYLSFDLSASTAREWVDTPEQNEPSYPAKITPELVTWEIRGDPDSGTAKRSFDRNSGVLTETDPEKNVDLWNCTKN